MHYLTTWKPLERRTRQTHLVFHSSSDLDRFLRAALCFSSSLFFSSLARSIWIITAQSFRLQWELFNFQFQYVTKNYYQCLRSPWLVYPASACNQFEEWLPPSLYAARLVASRRTWSCTSAINYNVKNTKTQPGLEATLQWRLKVL